MHVHSIIHCKNLSFYTNFSNSNVLFWGMQQILLVWWNILTENSFLKLFNSWKPALVASVWSPISASCWHLFSSLGIRSCQWAPLLQTHPHSLHTHCSSSNCRLKSLVLRVLCMIVTGWAWGLISAVSPSKALAVYSGLQGGRQGLSLPRHHASPSPLFLSPPHGSHCSRAGSSSGLPIARPGWQVVGFGRAVCMRANKKNWTWRISSGLCCQS